jgi:hypothetical protein
MVLPTQIPPGPLSIIARGFANAGCNGNGNSTLTLTNALRVVAPDPNPGLTVKCGLNVMLVLDESAAAESHTRAIRAGTLAFLRHLSGTGSHVAITVFSSTARVPELGDGSPYLLVNDSTIADVFRPFIRGDPHGSTPGYNPSAANTGINWQAGLDAARVEPAPLVVFITAGNPDTFSAENGQHTVGADLALFAAVEAANRAKAHPHASHIFAVGVGDAVRRQALQDISGDQEFNGSASGDFALDRFPQELVHTLREEMLVLCKSVLTINQGRQQLARASRRRRDGRSRRS